MPERFAFKAPTDAYVRDQGPLTINPLSFRSLIKKDIKKYGMLVGFELAKS
ncbi:MAG: hypothetical protein KKE23_02410 [Nanoarchaeota archaeon]|nr:hypothetical protein [Nanoarchaeota archaeon]